MDVDKDEAIWFLEEAAAWCRISPDYVRVLLHRYKEEFPSRKIATEGDGASRRYLTSSEVHRLREILTIKGPRPAKLNNRYKFLGVNVG